MDAVRPQHRRSKSSTSVLKSIVNPKSLSRSTKEKENTTPPSSSSSNVAPAYTPIWAEFATARTENVSPTHRHTTTKVALNDRSVAQETNMYSPRDYSPSKQRMTAEAQPMVTKKPKLKSSFMTKSKSSMSVFESVRNGTSNRPAARNSTETPPSLMKSSKTTKVPLKSERPADKMAKATKAASRDLFTMARKGSKVMGLVAAFNSKADQPSAAEIEPDPKEIDAAFEAVLESRNIPENMRRNLRSLKTTVKANLIKSNDFDFAGLDKAKSAPGSTKDKTPSLYTHRRGRSEVAAADLGDDPKGMTKRTRARSKTFTWGKNSSSPSKKQKPDTAGEAPAGGLIGLKSPSVVSLGKSNRASRLLEGIKTAKPEDYVSYLRTEQQPEKVQVGKVHKLRQLLRNETVGWVETFIKLGGMTEIVGLLHRIMNVDWREEHEDQLLHESLLCLKALCTTDIALQKLCEVEQTLFPALLGMIFDPEHKGPSEYTTRGIIINILLAHLTAAVNDPRLLPVRAADILGYLADPQPPEDQRPIPFILDMRQPRPYKVWHREVSSVTKEVFWIFMHNLNVIPLPGGSRNPNNVSSLTTPPSSPPRALAPPAMAADEYARAFFPQQRPPVPAAPYVGGVEWEATHYLAAHVDLLNGLVAARGLGAADSPAAARAERNALRAELRASGWERTMGAALRTCKDKFYDCVHDGLRTWVAAAAADGWDVADVRFGPPAGEPGSPRKKSPAKGKKKEEKPPVLDAPKLDLSIGLGLG